MIIFKRVQYSLESYTYNSTYGSFRTRSFIYLRVHTSLFSTPYAKEVCYKFDVCASACLGHRSSQTDGSISRGFFLFESQFYQLFYTVAFINKRGTA